MPSRHQDADYPEKLDPAPAGPPPPPDPMDIPPPSMSELPDLPPKHPVKSKTAWGLLAMTLGLIATMLGWPEGTFEFVADGVQLADVGAILSVLGYAWAEWGKRTAATTVTTITGKDRRKR